MLKQPPPPPSPNGGLSPGGGRGGGLRAQSTGKGPPQVPVFEGVYNNSRMLHVLTAAVGSTCEVTVRSGSSFEGIFKTLSSKLEVALDAVHRRPPVAAPGSAPCREDLVETMIFRPRDLVLLRLRDLDTETAAAWGGRFPEAPGLRLNGQHRQRALQRWEGGDGAGDDYDLDSDLSNGWDPNEMFKFNEETYGVKTTYDSSLASYTVPLEKENSDAFRQREARAAALAREIEASPQHRLRAAAEEHEEGQEERPARRDPKFPPLPQRPRGGLRCGSSRGGGGGAPRPPGGGGAGSAPPPPRGAPPHPEPGVNGGPSPKAQRPPRGGKGSGGGCPSPTPAPRLPLPRSPKPSPSPLPDPSPSTPPLVGEGPPPPPTSPCPSPTPSPSPSPHPGPAPPPPGSDLAGPPEPPRKGPSEQQRSQLEELRKFGAQFKLQPSTAPQDPPSEPLPPPRCGPSPPAASPEAQGGGGGGAGTPPEPPQDKDEQVKKSTLNPNAKEFNPSKPLLAVGKAAAPPSPGPRLHPSPTLGVMTPPGAGQSGGGATGGGGGAGGGGASSIYAPPPPYISYIPQLHVQAPQMYPYPVTTPPQGKYRGGKGALPPPPPPRSEPPHAPPPSAPPPSASAPPPPPLVPVAAPPPPPPPPHYSQYIPYGPPQAFGGAGQALVQPLPHYPSQAVFAPLLPGSPRLHPSPTLVSSAAPPPPQFPPGDQSGAPQALYAAVHQPFPPPTPAGNPPPPPPNQGGQQPPLFPPAPPPPGAPSPQSSFAQPPPAPPPTPSPAAPPPPPQAPPPPPQAPPPAPSAPPPGAAAAAAVYALHQSLTHGYGVTHVGQAHVQTGLAAAPPPPHPGAAHPPPQVMLLHQSHGGGQGGGGVTPGPFPYISHHQVQSQQIQFHPPGN